MKSINLILALSFVSVIASAQTGNTPNPPGNAYGLYHHFSGVTEEEVVAYLERTDHTIMTTPRTEDAGKTWTCTTMKSDGRYYYTIVYTDGENVIGFEDIAVG